jgi:hypothetical protein
MKWLVTVSVVYIGDVTHALYYDSFENIVNGPNDFAKAVNKLVGSAVCDEYIVTGVTIVPTNRQN